MGLKKIEDFEVIKRFFNSTFHEKDLRRVLRLIRIKKFGFTNLKYITGFGDLEEINEVVENTFLEYWNYCVYSDYFALDFVSEEACENEKLYFPLYNLTILNSVLDLYKKTSKEFKEWILGD